MDHIIYTSMTGANAAASRQAVLSNNLANVSTNGFRAELSTFRSVPLNGPGSSSRVFALETTRGHSETPGAVQRTGRNLDAMARDNAWFAVQGLDGTEAYTRGGAFEVSSTGTLVTPTGLPVLSAGGAPIDVPPGAEVTLGSDGSISAKTGNLPSTNLGRLKLATPTADNPLKRSDDGLFRTTTGDPLEADANARMAAGALESSNVNAVETMVGMIQVARQFETQMRLLQLAEAGDKSASQLLGVQG
ncbi:flagellar basal-body rod protein FlgF [Pseudorhodoferax sp. Leaf267]|uniref:flagellar basal-body rod protein FlgF n=1 Tax=Pseudorhodoferax sp. Leaf267 TaxID=1736316 RepID=UPI0006FD8BC3|nr:flagellar basal-body rod protein FlgF [Pseudorhodoferax sp. Leaf267]KQP13751.1 flagellar biosynthesis protein FlgF [Pseudorhodoferax sp. Leaf267]